MKQILKHETSSPIYVAERRRLGGFVHMVKIIPVVRLVV
jgi:hypothetical protein